MSKIETYRDALQEITSHTCYLTVNREPGCGQCAPCIAKKALADGQTAMKTNPNDLVHPEIRSIDGSANKDGEHRVWCSGGLTKREHFSVELFAAALSNSFHMAQQADKLGIGLSNSREDAMEQVRARVASAAVVNADALIKALNEGQG